ncbi:TonB-dependent receptor [Novosphingobium sp. M1R2S20]|uniref:TonB-dependent receptor n=1 Tax=Novosphingobium rhizovicinum TaxID=3228928 RepID=A0ABV3R820_9SPHN
MRVLLTSVAVPVVSIMIVSPASAQDGSAMVQEQAAASAVLRDGAATGGDIVVTARRRQESLQDVPLAVAVIGGEELRQRQIASDLDLQSAVPGLIIRQNGNANQFNYAIRGQSVDTYTNSPPGVLAYTNEVQLVNHTATSLYDLEGVQVLKGPQGTLFGRNTTGGAVLFETAKPGNEVQGYALARYGNYDMRHFEGAVTLPVSEALRLRVAAVHAAGGAFVKDISSGERLGKRISTSVRGTLLFEPTATFSNTTVVQHTDEGGTNLPSVFFSYYPCGSTFNGAPLFSGAPCLYQPGSAPFDAYVAANPNLYAGGVPGYAELQKQLGQRRVDVNTPLPHEAKSTSIINTTTYEASPGVTFKNIFGYNKTSADDGFDYDGTPYLIFHAATNVVDATRMSDTSGLFVRRTEQISDELQLQGEAFDKRLNYVLGAYYLDQSDINNSSLYSFDLTPIAAGLPFRYHQRTTTKSRAIFAQGSYGVTDKLNLTLGGRYTWDKVSARQLPGSIFGTDFPRESMSWRKPSWTVSLDYELSADLMVYAAQRGSWRTGGYNYSVLPVNETAVNGGNRFSPETTRDVEVGFKYSGSGMGMPVTFNAAFYNQWASDVQRSIYIVGVGGSPTLFTVNVPKAEITGAEVDMSLRAASWLRLGASGAYTNARYTSGAVTLLGSPTVYGPYADAPEWSGNAFADINHSLGGGMGDLNLHFEVFGQTKMYFSNVAATQAPFTTIPGYVLANARVAWSQLLDTPLTAAFYAQNIFDRRYWAGGNAVGPALGINTAVPGRPRSYGIELRADF